MSVSGVQVGRVKAALGELGSFVSGRETVRGEDMFDSYITDCLHTAAVKADLFRSTFP